MTGRRFQRTLRIVALATIVAVSRLFAGGPACAAEAPQAIVVELDQAKLVNLPQGQGRVVLVDPTIVRVTPLLDGSRVVLTGLSFGQTNLVVLDRAGAVVMQSTVRVKEPSDPGVTVHRGQERMSYYDCVRQCQGRLQLGDTSKEFQDIGEQMRGREGLATSPPPPKSMNSSGAL
jgi:hypothetical protein